MISKLFTVAVVGVIVLFTDREGGAAQSAEFRPQIATYIKARISEFDEIPEQRKVQLKKLARYVETCKAAGKTAKVTFICTHNSRRSHMAQIWAAVAAARYGIDAVETYSGGTEATAFNPRAVSALERAGFQITDGGEASNKRYTVVFASNRESLVCFSKVYDSEPNPASDFCAVMTCSQADKSCPVVRGASVRLSIPYDDPKVADGTPEESEKYDERSAQIAREMLFAFSQVK